ncbi:MAG: prepilin-type N-terminal cleavage/methylation domain-containing protein [Verrucomicrobiae bacterium]|nr:prepilin-type N-terminal cleavage/methylation domain-containing protein [Verrucomicrobiae bacterium]
MRKRDGFTLVEMLVTICILSMLVAMLSPALKNARDKARQISCLSNLRGLGQVFQMYGHDYEESIPSMYDSSNGLLWYDMISEKGYLKTPVYNNNNQIWTCPAEPPHDSTRRHGQVSTFPAWVPLTDYAINSYIAPSDTYLKLTQFRNPSAIFLLCDANSYFTAYNGGNPYYIDYRHGGGLNFLFLDGHCEWGPKSFIVGDADLWKRPPWKDD